MSDGSSIYTAISSMEHILTHWSILLDVIALLQQFNDQQHFNIVKYSIYEVVPPDNNTTTNGIHRL